MFKTPLDRFRFIAFVEGCSFLLIGFTMILKYRYDMPAPNYNLDHDHDQTNIQPNDYRTIIIGQTHGQYLKIREL